MRTLVKVVFFLFLSLSGCGPVRPSPPKFNAGYASQLIRNGMTQQEAITAIGWRPTSIEANSIQKIVKFDYGYVNDENAHLTVYFSNYDENPKVTGWSTNPYAF